MPDSITIEQFADWLTHHGLSEFAKLGIPIPDSVATRSATNEAAGVRLVVTIARVEKEPYACIVEMSPSKPAAKLIEMPLKEIERCIMEAAPRADAEPITMTKLARISGYACNGHFRGHVAGLIDRGLLVRVTGGIRRAK